ncbi:MAG: cytochrome c oxidase assembly factor Coa1 family protein [Allomuricauda sp.]
MGLAEDKSWWKRNWKWLTVVLGILLLFAILVISSPVGKKLGDMTKAYADLNLIEDARLKAQENKDVTELLGTLEPVDGLSIMRGIINYSNNDTTVDAYVHITGSKGKARMRVFADWNNGQWVYNNISVVNNELPEPIVVVDSEK